MQPEQTSDTDLGDLDEIVFDGDSSIRSFLNRTSSADGDGGLRVGELIVELGDGEIRNETLLLLESAG